MSVKSLKAWKEEIDRFMKSSQCRELDRIDGEAMEFEWTKFPGIHFIADSRRDPEHDD